MGILGSISRYLRTYGRLMYADPQGFARPMLRSLRGKRKRKSDAQSAYLDLLEPRVLMTTVYGGDVFRYTDARGNTVTATLNGNVVAELVSAVQAGGISGRNVTAVGGHLIFGDIVGTFTSGPRKGVIVGNGSVPIDNGTQGSPTQGNAHITITGASYPDPDANPALPGNQVNLQTLSTDLAGRTFTFNIFDIQPNGSLTLSPADATSKLQDFTMQLIQLDNTTMAGTVVYTIDSDQVGSILPFATNTTHTFTYSNVGVRAAAFNPIDNKLYFEFHYQLDDVGPAAGTGNATTTTTTIVDEIFSIDPNNTASGFTDVGAVDVTRNNKQRPRQDVTAMTFTLNALDPTTATLYISEQPNGTGGPPNLNPAPQARLLIVPVDVNGSFNASTGLTTVNLYEGYGGQRSQLTGLVGLSVLPGSLDGGGDGFIFGVVNDAGSSHLTRIDLNAIANGSANATSWGATTDLYESTARNPRAPFDGQSLTGLTYNPTLVNPFTGQLGAFMSIDTATTNLDFINHKLRINAGDVFSVYSAVSDINSSIVFQGQTLYQGDSGGIGRNGSPANTGTVYIGYKGQIPDNSTNETYVASTPFLTGQIVGSIGVMPGLIQDTTDLSANSAPTDKLFAGLDVARSLQQAFGAGGTGSIFSQTLGQAFNNVSGLAISPTDLIAVVNSYYYNGDPGDRLAFVSPTTGQIITSATAGGSPVMNIVMNNTAHTPLKNLQALAYGDPNLDGSAELYAVYDLGDGNGPTLGILTALAGTANQEIFTPIQALGLGAHGRVSSISFSPGGTTGDPTHQSLYVVADPNFWDFDGTKYLYQATLTFAGTANGGVSGSVVANAPLYDLAGNVVLSGGIGAITDLAGSPLNVVSMVYDADGQPLVLDRKTGRLMDLDLNTGTAGANFASGVGQINPTVAGVALDPETLQLYVVDNLTGVQTSVSQVNTDSSPISASAILMKVKNFNEPNASAVNLGKFLVDGTISGKVTVPGSMNLFYAGWLATGDVANGGSWIVPAGALWGSSDGTGLTPQSDNSANENYFKDNFYIGGDIRNIAILTDIGTLGNGTNSGAEVLALGKIGAITALGRISGVVHANNQNFIPNLTDASSLVLTTSLYDSFGLTFKGSATATSSQLLLTSGLVNQAGSVFANKLQNIDNFNANFTFSTIGTSLGIDGGIAFVLQDQSLPALGGAGAGLGYSGILHSAALEFNFDPNAINSIGFKTNGQVGYTINPGFAVGNGDTIAVNMTYNGTNLLVLIRDVTLGTVFSTSFTTNLVSILGAHGAYVGFTGSSGTAGNTTTVTGLSFNGFTTSQIAMAQEELQHYNTDTTDFPSFAAGWLQNTASSTPFNNQTFATAQFLGSVRNSVSGQPDVIHLQGTLEGAQTPKNGWGPQNTVDYFAFGMMAGQTATVSVTPRVTTGGSATATLVHFAVFDPDGNMIQSDYNWYNSTATVDRAITFTADRPGAYRVAITNASTTNNDAQNFLGGGTPGNAAYDLYITGAGDMGIGAVVARGAINLRGSLWKANSTASVDTITNPSIWSDSGDVGAVQAGGIITAQVGVGGLVTLGQSQGMSYSGTSSSDVYVPFGNLRSMVGGGIGEIVTLQGGTQVLEHAPDINVGNNVGLIASTVAGDMLAATFSRAPKNIQIISAAGDLSGVYRANQAISVIRAGTVSNRWYDYLGGEWTDTEFNVDADRTGADGRIDLIDVTGDWGAPVNNVHYTGAALVTGPGGNIGFMRVGGFLSQDSVFNTGDVGTNGEIVHQAGTVSYTDDSGVRIVLDPGSTTTVSTSGTVTTAGVITTRTYGVRGAGGVVIVDASSTLGLKVTATSNSASVVAEIGSITVNGAGVPIEVVNGVPMVNGTTGTLTLTASSAQYNNVILTNNNTAAKVNVFTINGGTIDTISNDTNGEIYEVTAGDVGKIVSRNNIGVIPTSVTGTKLISTTNFNSAFPFTPGQHMGISVANVGSIVANKAIGNVLASGVIGTITANADNQDDPNVFEGLQGPVVINGTATATFSTGTTIPVGATSNIVTRTVSLTKANIGEGIPAQGADPAGFHSGIFAQGRIVNVTGSGNADIRGPILSLDSIGTVNLTNGSIINTLIDVWSTWQMSQNFANLGITIPTSSTIDVPVYMIDSVNIAGNGGIIASVISASSIKNVTVAPTGFGIINSEIFGVALGTLNNISAGGYGFRSVYLNFARVDNMSATGSGAVVQTSAFNARVRTSETLVINPATNTRPTLLDDLDIWLFGDPLSSVLTGVSDVAGLTTGQISSVLLGGRRIGTVSAYDIRDSSFDFSDSAGTFQIKHDVVDTKIISGSLNQLTVGNDATDFEVSISGSIGPVSIGGNFMSSASQTSSTSLGAVTTLSQIVAKGTTGNIKSFVEGGSFGGLLLAEGSIGSITIGTGSKTTQGSGDLTGTITVNGNQLTSTVLNSLKIFGSVLAGGIINLTGKVGTVDIGGGIASDAQNVTIRGDLSKLLIGSDTFTNGSDLANTLTLTGSLTSALLVGMMSGALIVERGVGNFTLTPDTATATNSSLLTGSLSVAGTLSSATINGAVSGSVVAGVLNSVTVNGALSGRLIGGKSIAKAVVGGNLQAGGEVTSSLGDIKSLTVKGDIDGLIRTPNGAISSLSFTGNLDATGGIFAKSLGGITVPGTIAGTINATNAISSIKAGSIASTANITAGSLASITSAGDFLGSLSIGDTSSIKITVSGNFGATANIQAPLTLTVNGNMLSTSSIIDDNVLTALTVKGALSGSIIIDRLIGNIAAGSMANAIITAGQGLSSLKVTGLMANSLVQVGISRGVDNIFGTDDLNEQGRMGDLGTLSVGNLTNALIAAGGNIGGISSSGIMTDSVISSGLVLSGNSIAAALADATPLGSTGEITAALQGSKLLHGSISSVNFSKAGVNIIGSAITAGVSPGADGTFGTVDDNVNSSQTGGNSLIGSFKGTLDGASNLMANSIKAAIPGLQQVTYSTGSGADSILSADPISGPATLVVGTTTPGTLTTASGTIVVKVSGPAGTTVSLFDNATTTDRLDTMLISGPATGGVSVTVTTSNPDAFSLGRVIATDNTQVSSFTFNGDILGDVSGGPSLWLDSDVSTFAVRNLPNDGTWDGRIGGNVGKLTLNQLGPGKFRIGGRVNTLTIASSVGNPLVQQLGTVTPPTPVTQIAYDPTTGNVYATDGLNLLNVDVLTGSINTSSAVHTLLTNGTVNLSGLAFDAAGRLFGVATLNSQNPINMLGSITTTGDTLHGLAVKPDGTIWAIDSSGGTDKLVIINPVTGAETLATSGASAGIIRDGGNANNTYSGNILALASDANGQLWALTNDVDGIGAQSTASGYALGKIVISNGAIRFSSPITVGASGSPILLTGTVTNPLTALAVSSSGAFYVVENIGGGVQQLDTFSVGSAPTLTAVGLIKLAATDTSLVGIGFDEAGNLLGMNLNGSNSELIGITLPDPTLSVRLDAPGLIAGNLGGFAIGKTGDAFTTYAYTTDSVNGGKFFVSPGVVSTLGTLDTAGAFTQLLPFTRNASGAPILGNVTGIAVDASDNIFAISDQGVLAEYSSLDGSLIGGAPIGTVTDAFGHALTISRIAFNANGELIGLSVTGNNLVKLGTTSSLLNGAPISLATNVSESGTADAADLTALSFAVGTGQVLSYSTASGNFVNLLTTTPGSIGGITANSIGSATLPAGFSGHIGATGGGGKAVQGIDSVKLIGSGTFTGDVTAVNSIGTFSGSGINFQGSLVSHADIKSVSLTGSVASSAVIAADASLGSFSLTGDFDGQLLAHLGSSVSIKGSLLAHGLIAVTDNLGSLSITGSDSGIVTLGSNKTFTLSGALTAGATVNINGAAGNITVSGGTELGSLLLAHDVAATVTIGQTLAGVVGIRNSLTTAKLTNLFDGVFAVGQDLKTLTVSGNVDRSILAVGTWIGSDGVYNTADDVIFGGSLATAKIGGVFTDSVITAGILPPVTAVSGNNNIPSNFSVFDYNLGALNTAEIDGAQSGGIGLSYLGNITFSKPVVSSAAASGLFSAIVASNGISKVSTPATTANLHQITRSDAPGAPTVVSSFDVATQQFVAQVSRFSLGELHILFSEPLDTASLNDDTIQVFDSATGVRITGLTFSSIRQAADDGSIQTLVTVSSSTLFNGSTGLVIQLLGQPGLPTITDISGTRSSLLDYNQDGVNEFDPFGTQFVSRSFVIGPPVNDNQANATVITGFPASVVGTNVNATAEAGELTHAGNTAGSSVWWSWTSPITGAVQVTTDGSDFDTVLSVYESDPGFSNILVGENDDDAAGLTSSVFFNAIQGTTYLFAVDGNSLVTGTTSTGQIVLSLATVPPPANDNLANATVLPGVDGASITGQNFTATAEVGEQPHDLTTASNSVWYAWTAPSTGSFDFDTQGSDFFPVISVYSGDNTSVATLTSEGEGFQNVLVNVIQGTTYYIAIDADFPGETGNIQLTILSANPPANDLFANAPTLIGAPVSITGNTTFADLNLEVGEPSNLGATQTTRSVWYNWIAPTSGLYTFDTIGSTFDTTIGIYTGTALNNLVLHAADDQAGGNNTSLTSLNVVAGQTYHISISSWLTTVGGNYVLNIS